MKQIKTICAWCNKLIHDGPLKDGRVSHGCCQDCYERVKAESTTNQES